jgi:hypothetical protein
MLIRFSGHLALFSTLALAAGMGVAGAQAPGTEAEQRGVATVAPSWVTAPQPQNAPQTGMVTIAPGPSMGAPPGMPPPGGQAPPCIGEFLPLRQDAEKRAGLLKAAAARKASREEVCKLFTSFAAAEGKMLKFLQTHQSSCGIPAEAVTQVKGNHEGTLRTRQQVCSADATPARPAGPNLSDALGARTPGPTSSGATGASGFGTWNTLSGNPIK